MAFKSAPADAIVAESPDRLLRDLTRRRIPDVLPHQAEIMRAYAELPSNLPDVALQLPTGSGKTLVGLLIAEWRRRKYRERVVYLCPTRQLVHQVVDQAQERYGLSVGTFVGAQRDYPPANRTDYQQAERVAITTYSALFNTNSFFDNADVIVLDDAHAAENYVAQHWTLRVERFKAEHAALHQALCAVLAPYLAAHDLALLRGAWEDVVDRTWVDMLPAPTFLEIKPQLIEILDVHATGKLAYPWSVLRGHLDGCHMYLSPQDILIRPLLPPTFSHQPFERARQRIYMSATLGAGGDLERLTGRKNIHRLAAPAGWDTQGVGRRFFIFPGMSLTEDESAKLRVALMERAGRSVVLVPSDAMAQATIEQINETIKFKVFEAEDIEASKAAFVSSKDSVAVIANRYDGVDFAGDECRLLFIEGLPKAMNSQERFLMSRMGANVLFNERVQTRVVQAIGRCTRSLEDYSAVVVSGDELPDYIADIRRRKYLHPELQAEIAFGVQQSRDTDAANLIENFDIFLANGKPWEDANRMIVEARAKAHQEALPVITDLTRAVQWEIDYQTAMWRQDFAAAVAAAERVLGVLDGPELRGYRALWSYLAGTAAYLGSKEGVANLDSKARHYFTTAYKSAPDISWLSRFARIQTPEAVDATATDATLLQQVERMAAELSRLGATHDRAFAKLERQIIEGLNRPETFEAAQVDLGKLLGFISGKEELEGSPDPWWICGAQCIVFEDYVNTTEDGELDVTKARQASSHPDWMRAHVPAAVPCTIVPTLVTPARFIRAAALPHAQTLSLWRLPDFLEFARTALETVRILRATFFEQGDLVWQAQAADILKARGLDFAGVVAQLTQCRVVDAMTHR